MPLKIAVANNSPHIFGNLFTHLNWYSDQTLFDYDALVLDTDSVLSNQARNGWNQMDQSFWVNKRQAHMQDFMAHGRPTVVLVANCGSILSLTGGTPVVEDLNKMIYNSSIEVVFGRETDIEPRLPQPLSKFLAKTAGMYQYRGVLLAPPGTPLLTIRGTRKVVGCYVWEDERRELFLPPPVFKDKGDSLKFASALHELLEQMSAPAKQVPDQLPELHRKYILSRERELMEREDILTRQITEAEAHRNEVRDALYVEQALKHLFLSKGEALVQAARAALVELGFTVTEGVVGRDDLICDSEEGRIVVEVKGRDTRSAAEKDSAQLEKWAAREYEESGRAPKALLVMNAYCQVPLEKRNDASFPPQMVPYASKRDHCLCTGLDLLRMVHAVRADTMNKPKLRKQIFDTAGVFDSGGLPELEDVLVFISNGEPNGQT